ncbi:MAG TPA: DUF4352 domain-containing protein [Capsulimonadaceae bacterium]|jgi:hypothetical protein
MKNWIKTSVFAIVVLCFASPQSHSAPPKPKTKVPTASSVGTNHATIGTTQLSGENAQFGVTYTLGKLRPMNITLRSAEYSVEPLLIGKRLFIADAAHKLLILHMTYHNPIHADQSVRWDTYRYTVVDAADQNHLGLVDLGAESDKSVVQLQMKPAQKMDVYGALLVPAEGEMPKLILQASDGLVLRYDLRGKVKGLAAVYADPADKTGATALATIAAPSGSSVPVGAFLAKVNKAQYVAEKRIGTVGVDKTSRLCTVEVTIKNGDTRNQSFRWDTLRPKLVDTAKIEIGRAMDALFADRDRSFSAPIEPGQEVVVRYLFKVPNDTTPKTLTLTVAEGRLVVFDIGTVIQPL